VTELFSVNGVKYFVLGGGGAEQDPILPGRTSFKVPAGYPPDLYWKGQRPRKNKTIWWWTHSPESQRSLRSIAGLIPAPPLFINNMGEIAPPLPRFLHQRSLSTGDGLCAQQLSVKEKACDEQNDGKHH